MHLRERFDSRSDRKTIEEENNFANSPCMQEKFLLEALHLNLDAQCYMGEKFAEAVYFSLHLYLGVDIKALQCIQQ